MINKLGDVVPIPDETQRTSPRPQEGGARIHIFPDVRGAAEDERERAILLTRLKERVRLGTYLPDVRYLALSLILDDRLPLVEG